MMVEVWRRMGFLFWKQMGGAADYSISDEVYKRPIKFQWRCITPTIMNLPFSREHPRSPAIGVVAYFYTSIRSHWNFSCHSFSGVVCMFPCSLFFTPNHLLETSPKTSPNACFHVFLRHALHTWSYGRVITSMGSWSWPVKTIIQ